VIGARQFKIVGPCFSALWPKKLIVRNFQPFQYFTMIRLIFVIDNDLFN
jgi:hypothetical protein